MPSLRDIKRSIKSVKNTRQITKAMKMVSAAKLRRAQEDITAARPYAEKMNELIASLASKIPAESHPLLAARESESRIGVIFIASDRGLCGSFNAVLFRTVEAFMRERGGADVRLHLIGRRAIEYFKRRPVNVAASKPFGGRPNYGLAAGIAKEATALFTSGELDAVYVIYSEFKSALSQRPVAQRVLPIAAPKAGEEAGEGESADVIYEPSAEDVLSTLLPKYVEVQVFRALLESAASEHGARMTAMDSASKNASEMIGGLTLRYNRLRQAAITKELMEIISGAEALKE